MLLAPVPAEAGPRALPSRTWVHKPKAGGTVLLAFSKPRQFAFTFSRSERMLITERVAGSYKLSEDKPGTKVITLKVVSVLSYRRSSSSRVVRRLKQVQRLGTSLAPGSELRLTMASGCAAKRDTLTLCRQDKLVLGKPRVTCHFFFTGRKSPCGASPAMGGSKRRPPGFTRGLK